jgi:hypothetical protein
MRSHDSAQIGTIVELLENSGLALWVVDGRLSYRGSRALLEGELFESLKARKDEAVAFLQSRTTECSPAALEHLAGEPAAPLNRSQSYWWDRRDAGLPDQNVELSFRLDGPPEPARLDDAVAALAERHGGLRSRIEAAAGRPAQVRDPGLRIPIEYRDGPLPEDCLGSRPFRIDEGEMLRVRVHTLPDGTWVTLCAPEIALDLLSLFQLSYQLTDLYQRGSATLPGDQAGLDLIDYNRWEHARFGRRACNAAYWPAALERVEMQTWSLAEDAGSARLRPREHRENILAIQTTHIAPGSVVAAFAAALAGWRQRREVLFMLRTQINRPPLALGIPGCFTHYAPFLFHPRGAAEPPHLHASLDQALAATMDPKNAVELPPLARLGALKVNATVVPSPVPLQAKDASRRISQGLIDCEIEFLTIIAPDGLLVSLDHARDLFAGDDIELLWNSILAELPQHSLDRAA